MKKTIATILILCFPFLVSAQDITGQWNGELKISEAMSLRLVFHIEENDEGYSGTLDSPDQNAMGIPVSSVEFSDPELKITMSNLQATYEGKLENGEISGTFTQAGQSFPLQLGRKEIEKKAVARPQEPKPPYPYLSEEVSFRGGEENVMLSGTLTMPKEPGPHPVVVLITGSGPQDRNEELMNHKPFLVLADYLTRNGIGVLRYDDRGFGQSTGDFGSATSLDFAEDALAAVTFLKSRSEVDSEQIGLVGHSEGGLVAPVASVRSDDIAFIVLLAGPGVSGRDILVQQTRAIAESTGMNGEEMENDLRISQGLFDLMVEHNGDESMKDILRDYLEENIEDDEVQGVPKEQFINNQVQQLSTPWFQYFLVHEPANYLKEVKCPVLAVNGEKDIQVIPANLTDIEEAVRSGGNDNIQVHEFKGMNHLFQECEKCTIAEYATIEQTFSPVALEYIANWINEVTAE